MVNQLPRAALLALSVLAVLGTAAQARSWSPEDYPNPGKDPAACGRPDVATGRSRICDADGVLSAKSCDVVEGIIQASTFSFLFLMLRTPSWPQAYGAAQPGRQCITSGKFGMPLQDIEAGRPPYTTMDCDTKDTGYKVKADTTHVTACLLNFVRSDSLSAQVFRVPHLPIPWQTGRGRGHAEDERRSDRRRGCHSSGFRQAGAITILLETTPSTPLAACGCMCRRCLCIASSQQSLQACSHSKCVLCSCTTAGAWATGPATMASCCCSPLTTGR